MRFDCSDLTPKEAYALLISAIVPRPIAWVTTVDHDDRVNLAPFSFFTGICSRPPLLALSIGQRRWNGKWQPKDTLANIQATGELVVHIAPAAMANAVNASAAELPPGESEVAASELHTEPSVYVRPPRLVGCPVAMECKLSQIVWLGQGNAQALVVAEVLSFAVDDAVWNADAAQIDAAKLDPLSRLGGQWFGTLGQGVALPRPDWQATGFEARVAVQPRRDS